MVKGDIRVTIPNTHQGKEIGVRLLAQVLKEAGIGRGIGSKRPEIAKLHRFADGGWLRRTCILR